MKRSVATVLTWSLLIASALSLASLAIFSIYRENRQAAAQREETLSEQRKRLEQRLQSYFEEIKTETGRQLVSFHEEALEIQLERWQQSDSLIDSATVVSDLGYITTLLKFPKTEITHLDDPETNSLLRSGYYRDNKEIALYENGTAEPILFWTLSDDGWNSKWIVGHRLNEQRSTRIAQLNTPSLVEAFNALLVELSGPNLIAEFGPTNAKFRDSLSSNYDGATTSFLLPKYHLKLSLPDDGNERWLGNFGYAMVVVSLSFALFCAFLISRQVSRERRDALRKTTFVSQISHEFKTPLTSISLYAELLAEQDVDKPKCARYLSTISRESHRLGELVDNILALNALELGKKQYRLGDFNLVEAVNSIVADYRPSLAESRLRIDWKPPEASSMVHFDRAGLRQILLNLLENARKYASDGEIVKITLNTAQDKVELAVEDCGPGISAKARQRIFDPFYQEKSKLTDKSPGAGIGLSISRRLAADCHGKLSLDSEYAHGARFVLTLPIASSALTKTP